MSIKQVYTPLMFYGTLAELTASTRKWPKGCLLMPTDSDEVRHGNGTSTFANLKPRKAAVVAPLAGSTDAATISAKVDAVILALKNAGLMKTA